MRLLHFYIIKTANYIFMEYYCINLPLKCFTINCIHPRGRKKNTHTKINLSTLLGKRLSKLQLSGYFCSIQLARSRQKVLAPKQTMPVPYCAVVPVSIIGSSSVSSKVTSPASTQRQSHFSRMSTFFQSLVSFLTPA